MKRILSFLLSILIFASGMAQTSFPVQVTNQFDPISPWAYNSGQKTNSYAVQHLNRATLNTGTPSGIGPLYALNGGFSPQPGKATVIQGFYVYATRPIKMQIRVGTPTGVIANSQLPEMDLAFKVDSTVSPYIGCNWVIRNQQSVFIYCLGLLSDSDTATDIMVTPICYNITDDFNYDAKKVIEVVGTSITNGTGPDQTGYMYSMMFKDTLNLLGASVRNVLCGISGSTTTVQEPLFRQGRYDRVAPDSKIPDAVIIELAVNDASVGTASAVYVARLKYAATRFLANKKTSVIILGATPLGNTTAYNNSLVLDAAAASLVTTLKATYPNRVFFIPMADAFPRTDRAYYISSDAVGAEIHPNNAGNQAIMNNKINPWMATADGQIFVTYIKK